MEGVTPEFTFDSNRPPGTQKLGVVIAASKFEIQQAWTPTVENSVNAGDVVQRTITRRVAGTTAMMLPPTAPLTATGVRVYLPNPVVEDKIDRGQITATCIETIKYQFEKPGTF